MRLLLHLFTDILHLFQNLRLVSVHLQTYICRANLNKCHNKCKQMPQQMQKKSNNKGNNKCKQMPQHMQQHATTNANTCRALRQKMDQTYAKINAVTYAHLPKHAFAPTSGRFRSVRFGCVTYVVLLFLLYSCLAAWNVLA